MIKPRKVTKKDPDTGKRIATGKWEQLVCLGKDPDTGKKRWRSETFRTREECKAWAAKMEVAKGEGTLKPTLSRLTFADYLRTIWLPMYATQVRNVYSTEKTLMKWIGNPPSGVPVIGKKPLHKLVVGDFDKLYIALAEQGLQRRGIEHVHSLIKRALKFAVKKEELPRNPCQFATLPKPDVKAVIQSEADEDETGPVQSLDKEQTQRFLAAASEDRLAALWHTLLDGALRPGEAFGLQWRHIDWKRSVVKVRGTLGRVRGEQRKAEGKGWQFTKPKTKTSEGDVPLSDSTMWLLRKWKQKQEEERKDFGGEDLGFVFTTQFGTPLGNNLGRLWTRIMRDTDGGKGDLGDWGAEPTTAKGTPGTKPQRSFKPRYSMYVLRHTRLTLMYDKTKDILAVSRFARHKNISITARFYVHTKAEHTKEAAAESFRELIAAVS